MTLMEVMVVITLILLLTGALMFGLRETMLGAIGDVGRIELGKVAQHLDTERALHGQLPERLEDARIPTPKDRAGRPAVYARKGDGFDLRFVGDDGRAGTDDDVVWSPAP